MVVIPHNNRTRILHIEIMYPHYVALCPFSQPIIIQKVEESKGAKKIKTSHPFAQKKAQTMQF